MKTLQIYGADTIVVSELETELAFIAGTALLGVNYDVASERLDIELDVESLTGDEERALRNVVNEHLSRVAGERAATRAILDAEIADVNARFLLSAIANKTPAEIYTAMQNQIDNWGNLAQAKADLRQWLPLMAALIAVKLQKREG